MQKRRFPILALLPLAIVLGLVGLSVGGMFWGSGNKIPSNHIGKEAPPLPEDSFPGKVLLTQDMLTTGEVTIVNFWASWCPPCRAEHPTLLALSAEGLRVAGVNFRDQELQALAYLEESEDPFFAHGFDPRGRSAIDWGVTAPPETFIISGDGTVLFRFAGPLVGSDYEQRFRPELDKALAEH